MTDTVRLDEDEERPQLELHPKAKANYDARAEAVLRSVTMKPRLTRVPGFVPDRHVAAEFTPSPDTKFRESLVLPNGRVLERTFPRDGYDVGLRDEAYREFLRLCEQVQSSKPVRDSISLSTIEDHGFEWVRDRYTGESSASFTDYLLPKCEDMIRVVEIWIPIYQTHVPYDLPFGELTVKTFTATMFDALRDEYRLHNPPDLEKLEAMLNFLQQKYQGMAAATMFVRAEPKRAYEIAFDYSERAVAILRLYSQAAFIPEVMSCCVLMGQKEAQYEAYLVFREGLLTTSKEWLSGLEQSSWTIGRTQLNLMAETGIGGIIKLFFSESRSPFEQDIFESMMMYSRGLAALSPSDKVMYIFSALEALLLRDEQEPILANVPRRIAYVVATEAQDRLGTINTYKKAYGSRSGFVHHGRTVDDFDTLSEFLQVVWRFFILMVHRESPKHKTTSDFLAALDLHMLSGVRPDESSDGPAVNRE